MTIVIVGDIADRVMRIIAQVVPHEQMEAVKKALSEQFPERGMVISASKEELKDNKELVRLLYNDVVVKVKE